MTPTVLGRCSAQNQRQTPSLLLAKRRNPELDRSVAETQADQTLRIRVAGNRRASPAQRTHAARERFLRQLFAIVHVLQAPVVNRNVLRRFLLHGSHILLRRDNHDARISIEGTPCYRGVIQLDFLNHRHDSSIML